MTMDVSVILPAAGLGTRFDSGGSGGSGGGKVEFELDNKPVFLHAIEAFRGHVAVRQIILAVHPDRIDDFRYRWEDKLRFMEVTLVAGGTAERWDTVKRALAAVDGHATHIAVHDAARPVVSAGLIDRVFAAAEKLGAVIPGVWVSSTLKRIDDAPPGREPPAADHLDDILGVENNPTADARRVRATVPREHLVAVQTPQVFEASLLRRAYAAVTDGRGVTDDAGLVEALGEPVYVVEGDPGNVKITTAGDVELAQALLAFRKQAGAKQRAVADLFGDDDD